ncbi:MAG: secretin N-terminal domain-containing protein [Planctomycetota bacterium]
MPATAQRDTIEFDLADEVELPFLIDYVSERLSINVVTTNQANGKSVQILAPERVPVDGLLTLLEVSLRAHNLTLTPGPDENWYIITPTTDLAASATLPEDAGSRRPGTARQIGGVRRSTAPKPAPVELRLFRPEHISVQKAEQVLRPFMTRNGGAMVPMPDEGVLLVADFKDRVSRAADLLAMTDVAVRGAEIRFVPVEHASAETLAQQATEILSRRQQAVGGFGGQLAEIMHDERTEQLIVMGRESSLAEALEVITGLDVPVPLDRQPVQFYKLENAKAEEVLSTIQLLEDDGSLAEVTLAVPGLEVSGADIVADAAASEIEDLASEARAFVQQDRVRVAADPNTNSLIVVGGPSVQAVYAGLIERLDVRRPQVMIEVTLVLLDTSDSFSLGIEIGGNAGGNPEFISFSAFGVGNTDTSSGSITIPSEPALGFTGAILAPDIADVVVSALKTVGRARIVASPKLLVNDNADGTLSSTSQEPFNSVNASDTVSTTSFGGFVDAGTTIAISPRISNGDHLALDYSVELSSFTGERIADLPPPRVLNSIESSVTLPNGYTVVTGGLESSNNSDSSNRVPLLGDIPILGRLFRSDQESDSETTLFVFIRPTILRDDRFADLRYLSEQDVEAAGLPPDVPQSGPVLMH